MIYEGMHKSRLEPNQNNQREVAFTDTWKEWNRGGKYVHEDLLRVLLTEYSEVCKEGFISCWNGFNNYEKPPELDQKTIMAVSTFVQWLGSNNGMDFLEQALDKCGYEIRRK